MIRSILRETLKKYALNEKEDRKYEYSGVLAKLDIPFWDEVLEQINDDELYDPDELGKEDETHCTVLYGIDDPNISADDIKELTKNVEPFPIYLSSISIFDNEEFDVLKFDVESDELHGLHNMIADNTPHEKLYPKYHPHVTIAYLKKGEGEKYTKNLKKPIKLLVKELYFSSMDRTKVYWYL